MESKSTKIGIVSIRQTGQDRWLLRYLDPETGRDVRRRLAGVKAREIESIAAHISQEVLSAKGFAPGRRRATQPIHEGIIESIRLSAARDYVKRENARQGALFVSWLAANYPAAKGWGDMRPAMLQAYCRELEKRGLAFDSVRLRLAPVKQAWRHAYENDPENVRPVPSVRQAPRARREIVCLDARQMAILLDWLKANAPDLHGMACLQSLCGLREMEAAAIRAQDLDLSARTVRVADTGRHKPKNAASLRTIPICSEALEALKARLAAQRVRPLTGELFVSQTGTPWRINSLGHRRAATLRRAARATGEAALASVPIHRLRSSFATIASRLCGQDSLLRVYLGHSARDTLGAFCLRVEVADLRAVSDAMDRWRGMAEAEGAGTFLATFENPQA